MRRLRPPAPRPIDQGRAQLLLGGGLVLVGLWFLLREYLPDIDWGFVWPLALVAAGLAILVGALRRRSLALTPAPACAP